MALARAAKTAVLLGRPDDARTLIVELVDTLRQLGTRRWVAEANELTAIVLEDDQPDTAAVALGAAERLRTALGEPAGPRSCSPAPSKRPGGQSSSGRRTRTRWPCTTTVQPTKLSRSWFVTNVRRTSSTTGERWSPTRSTTTPA